MFRLRKRKKPNKIIVLLDFENLFLSFGPSTSIVETLNRVLEQIKKEVGEIACVFVFFPHHSAISFGEAFQKTGFYPILTPKSKTGEREKVDTTDEILIKFGKMILKEMTKITHFCLGSGDKHFVPLLKNASRAGLSRIIITANTSSLASELIGYADRKPGSQERMIYFLSKK